MTRRYNKRPRRRAQPTAEGLGSDRLWHPAVIRKNLAGLLLALVLSGVVAAIIDYRLFVGLLSGAALATRWWFALVGNGALALVIFIVGFLYFARLEPARASRRGLVASFAVLSILFVGAAELVKDFGATPYALPLSAAGVLFALLHSRRSSLVLSALLTLLIGLTLQQGGGVPILVLITLFAGAALVAIELAQVRTRLVILEAGLSVAVLQVAMIVAGWAAGLHAAGPLAALFWDLFWAAVNGLAVGIVLSAGLPLIELVFSTTTQIRLLELSDQNHPLMRRMVMEAPGTYHHSFIVGTIAEAAAESIGANALMVRVGAYFHDIGKLTRPDYFVENAMPGLNPHDHLSPTMSALIIASHPKDGVEIARDYRLPQPIIEIIDQHHGSSVIEYFYRRSLERNGEDGAPDEMFFRYTSPRPQTKEAGIVLLADAVEAASRTLVDPSAPRLKRLVHELSMKRLLDGQFDECGLSLAELHRAEESLVRTLCSLFHARIHYPAPLAPEQPDRQVGGEAS